jgi:DNA-binding NarL/FixJ family response regulator
MNQSQTVHSPSTGIVILKIGIVDDQQLFLKSLGILINTFHGCETVMEGIGGREIMNQLSRREELPDILLIDVDMPIMDGVQTAGAISSAFPSIKLVALSMKDDDLTIISMLKAGCCAYLIKDIHPIELEKALNEIGSKGYYNGDAANINYRRLILNGKAEEAVKLNDREMTFVKLACSDRTYNQIAGEMHLAERTIDGYREAVFRKLNVQSRVGMVMEAIRRGWVKV